MNKLSESVKKLWKIVFSFFLLSFRLLYNVQYMWSYPGSGSGWKLLIQIPLALPLWKPWTSFFLFYSINYFIMYCIVYCLCGPRSGSGWKLLIRIPLSFTFMEAMNLFLLLLSFKLLYICMYCIVYCISAYVVLSRIRIRLKVLNLDPH